MDQLGKQYAWMIGDTPDDVRASRGARVVPLGVLAPGDGDAARTVLMDSGAARVLDKTIALEGLLNGKSEG